MMLCIYLHVQTVFSTCTFRSVMQYFLGLCVDFLLNFVTALSFLSDFVEFTQKSLNDPFL